MSKHLNGNMKSKHHGHNKNGKDLKNKQIKKGGKGRNNGGAKLKRPATAYIQWVKKRMADFKSENNSLTYPEKIKKIADEWNHLTESEKQPYTDIYLKEKEIYDRKMGKSR